MTEKPERIGILGGTFNPIHTGHLILAQCAFDSLYLDRVLFVPCATPAHKDASTILSSEHRKNMIETAIEGDPRFEVSDIELDREGTSYAIDTVKQLKSLHPDADLFFIIGTDTLTELHSWRHIYSLLPLCNFASFARPGSDPSNLQPEDIRLDHPWPKRLMKGLTAGKITDISSSDIRHRIAEGMSIRYLVPQQVEMYISEHRLYG